MSSCEVAYFLLFDSLFVCMMNDTHHQIVSRIY